MKNSRFLLRHLCFCIIASLTVHGNTVLKIALSPLVFRATKNVESKEFVELGTFDASKLRQVRIALKIQTPNGKAPISREVAEVELAVAKREFTRADRLYKDGVVSKADYDSATERLRVAQELLDFSFGAEVVGVVGDEEVPVVALTEANIRSSLIVDSPPNLLRVKIKGKGAFTFYAWGQ